MGSIPCVDWASLAQDFVSWPLQTKEVSFRMQSLKWFVEFLYNEPLLNNVSFFLEILQIWGRNQSWQWSGDWWAFGWWNNCIHFKALSAQTSASYHFERSGVQLFWKFGKKNPRHSQLPSNSLKVVGYFYFKMIICIYLGFLSIFFNVQWLWPTKYWIHFLPCFCGHGTKYVAKVVNFLHMASPHHVRIILI